MSILTLQAGDLLIAKTSSLKAMTQCDVATALQLFENFGSDDEAEWIAGDYALVTAELKVDGKTLITVAPLNAQGGSIDLHLETLGNYFQHAGSTCRVMPA